MKNLLKSCITVFVMAMAFMVTGITSEAAVSNLTQTRDTTSSVRVEWKAVAGAKYYGWQIATDSAFKNIVKSNYVAENTYALATGLNAGSTYYVRVGHGTTSKNCYANYSKALEVVTTPEALPGVAFVGANDNSATISYQTPGANVYYIYEGYSNALIATTPATSYTITMNNTQSNYYKVAAGRRSASGYSANTSPKSVTVNLLTSKIATKNFGLDNVLSLSNKISVVALYSGSGFEVELTNAGGAAYKQTMEGAKAYSSTGSSTSYFLYKENRYLKYRVRAFVDTDNGRIYGSWSDYKAFCEMNGKYTRGSRKINLKWTKVKGNGKIKISVSTKKSSGYKTFKTLKGSATKVTINKCGKSLFKSNKSYYIRAVPLVKINGKYVASDFYLQQQIKIR
ncbi:MAG: fibronectin type III domain-containing protein [Lachnospiraceae bacterium]|nr:fibronectin type III domain-containing protein [Lachnospiraceae bacterium]MDE6626556.1 fibronectin type III domain-containing protein [Lachnospiraceae bacterium]